MLGANLRQRFETAKATPDNEVPLKGFCNFLGALQIL
jgi:hypothetical protein